MERPNDIMNFKANAKIFMISCFLVCSALLGQTFSLRSSKDMWSENILFKKFNAFVIKQNRSYIFHKNTTELFLRFKIFKESLRRAELLNRPYQRLNEDTPVYGINKFADMTPSEFRAKHLTCHHTCLSNKKYTDSFTGMKMQLSSRDLAKLPKVVDWRKKSVLTKVKDQKDCGACWAFSVAETVESMAAIQHNISSVPDLSVQQLIDCDSANFGCEGGDICSAALWAQRGVVEEKNYPLTRHQDQCKATPATEKKVRAKNASCKNLTNQEDVILQTLAYHGPVAVAVDAETWHNYVGGIIRFHCSAHINHAVQIVGYNLEGDVPYYIIRNSWGPDFGDGGYLYVKYGENLCGLASEVVSLSATSLT